MGTSDGCSEAAARIWMYLAPCRARGGTTRVQERGLRPLRSTWLIVIEQVCEGAQTMRRRWRVYISYRASYDGDILGSDLETNCTNTGAMVVGDPGGRLQQSWWRSRYSFLLLELTFLLSRLKDLGAYLSPKVITFPNCRSALLALLPNSAYPAPLVRPTLAMLP